MKPTIVNIESDSETEFLRLPTDQDASGRSLGEEEVECLIEVVRRGILTSTHGRYVREFEKAFALRLGVPHSIACSSGTAAIHAAVAAIDPEPGDEIVTSGIVGMGVIGPILFQGGIPVFADVDPTNYNLTAESIQARLSHRTRAILVTHLFGNPCDMPSIMALARRHEIPVIEDCSQALLATSHGRPVGTLGDIGCYSLQQGRHITTGEGGVLATSNPQYARRAELFVNKAWGDGDPQPDHYFLALNYRMNEITGAVAMAQLGKLEDALARRIVMAEMLTELLVDIPGIGQPIIASDVVHTYGKYTLDIDPVVIAGGTDALASVLRSVGIPSTPGYIKKPIFCSEAIRNQRTFGNSRFPFTFARPEALDYRLERFPGTCHALARMLVLPWNERYQVEHVRSLATRIRSAAATLSEGV